MGRSPSGERGLKYLSTTDDVSRHRRSPSGERGLKLEVEFRPFQER